MSKLVSISSRGKIETSYIGKRYDDLLNPKPEIKKTGEEIVAEVIEKSGIEVIL